MFKLPDFICTNSQFISCKSITALVRCIADINGFDGDFINIMNLDSRFNYSNLKLKVYKKSIYITDAHGSFVKIENETDGYFKISTGYCCYNNNIINYENVCFHNKHGPAFICILVENNHIYLLECEYFINNKLHCNYGPAMKLFSKDGFCYYKSYYINGFCHNPTGPAYLEYQAISKKLHRVYFFINGKCLEREVFINKLERRLKC